ncbi:MAG: beta-lactamase [Anaerocolumna sp.]|nr:beta-lactamase [Anaerocolumna sp.]
MRNNRRKKYLIRIILIAIIIVCVGLGVFKVIVSQRMSQIPKLSFHEMLEYTTKDNKKAVITVGIIKEGKISYTVYGNNASTLPEEQHTYEIGSLTKTFTSSLLCKAIEEGKIDLYQSIDKYIDLPENQYYPTVKSLVTHTSGYKGYYFEWQMVSNFIHKQQNDFYGIDESLLLKRLRKVKIDDKSYNFKYSNFGFAIIGKVLESVYDNDYAELMNHYIVDDLKLNNTRISDEAGDLKGYWSWRDEDAYLPTGAITSTINDMMQYINLHMSNDITYLSKGHEIIENATTNQYEKMNIRVDGVGIGWMIDTKNNLIWHNGGTSNFNSYAAFDMKKQIGVVVLSNCSPSYRIPATVMGVKLITTLQSESDRK